MSDGFGTRETMDEKIRQIATAYAAQCHEEELELLRALAQVPAPSGHEERRAELVRDWLLEQGAPASAVLVDDAKNVILSLPGPASGDDGIAVFAAHTDVAFPDTEPLPLVETAERIACPGVGDDTANLVGLLFAARYLLREHVPLKRRVLVVANSCEEGLGNLAGTRALFERYGGQVREYTSFDLYLGMHVTSAVGSHRWEVRCRTQGGHSWRDFGRASAIERLCSLVEALYAIELPASARTTVNVGRIEGGTTVNTIAAEASALIEYRSSSQRCLDEMREKFIALVEGMRADGIGLDARLLGERPTSGAALPPRQAELIERADEVLRELGGTAPEHSESSTDANVPLSLGIPAHTVGAVRGDMLHTRDEWIDKASLEQGLAVILALMLEHASDRPHRQGDSHDE